jgi:hypothetical protein
MPVRDISNTPEVLLDAIQWEQADQNNLYEACLHFVNVGVRSKEGRVHISEDGREVVVVSWETGGGDWNRAIRAVQKFAKTAKQSRQHRKQVQAELLNTAVSDSMEATKDI